jgi:hypothetical protein
VALLEELSRISAEKPDAASKYRGRVILASSLAPAASDLPEKIGSRYFIDERVLSFGKHAVFGGDTIVRIR